MTSFTIKGDLNITSRTLWRHVWLTVTSVAVVDPADDAVLMMVEVELTILQEDVSQTAGERPVVVARQAHRYVRLST